MTRPTITDATFDALAFPVARVRFSGPTDRRGSRYFATIRRDNERTYRASVGELDAERPRDGARRAARACWEKLLADLKGGGFDEPYVAIPGDLAADAYSFTFVPAALLNGGAA